MTPTKITRGMPPTMISALTGAERSGKSVGFKRLRPLEAG